jgi:hypothetical protein
MKIDLTGAEHCAKKILTWIAVVGGTLVGLFFGLLLFSFSPGLFAMLAIAGFFIGAGIYAQRSKLRTKSKEIGPVRCTRCNSEGLPSVSMGKSGAYFICCARCGNDAWQAVPQ